MLLFLYCILNLNFYCTCLLYVFIVIFLNFMIIYAMLFIYSYVIYRYFLDVFTVKYIIKQCYWIMKRKMLFRTFFFVIFSLYFQYFLELNNVFLPLRLKLFEIVHKNQTHDYTHFSPTRRERIALFMLLQYCCDVITA
jgi:hypothetical protein